MQLLLLTSVCMYHLRAEKHTVWLFLEIHANIWVLSFRKWTCHASVCKKVPTLCTTNLEVFAVCVDKAEWNLVILLFINKLNVHLYFQCGWTVVHFAAYNGHLEMLQELLERLNCEADKRDMKVFIWMWIASSTTTCTHTHMYGTILKHKHKYVCACLVTQHRPYSVWIYSFMQLKWTPLYAAVSAGHIKIVQYLIEEKGCDSAVLVVVG